MFLLNVAILFHYSSNLGHKINISLNPRSVFKIIFRVNQFIVIKQGVKQNSISAITAIFCF